MSEQNILNPSSTSPLRPDYAWNQTEQAALARFVPRQGAHERRRLNEVGRVYDLEWKSRPLSTKRMLRQWEAQFERDFFSFFDAEENRYFSGSFDGPLMYSPAGYERWSIKGRFVEEPGRSLYAYPSNWDDDAVFINERAAGVDTAKLTGAGWAYAANVNAREGFEYESSAVDDKAELLYFGYGFRYWSRKAADLGISEILFSVDGTTAGYVSLTNVDAYNAADVDALPMFTKEDVPLGWHRVAIRVTHTKNGASAGYAVAWDALEVMR